MQLTAFMKEYVYSHISLQVKGYMSKDGVELPVIVGMERLDDEVQESANAGGEMGLDVVIDTVWWMFSTTYARCYSHFYPNEDVILLFFQMFRDDILDSFLGRWYGLQMLYKELLTITQDFISHLAQLSSHSFQTKKYCLIRTISYHPQLFGDITLYELR